MDLIRQRYDRELERANKLDDEARQLVGSILVVVGFLLGAGVINLLSVSPPSFSALYFVGIIVLVGSIVFVYKAIREKFKFYHVADDPKGMLETDPDTALETDPDTALREKMVDPDLIPYLEIVKSYIRRMNKVINNNLTVSQRKARLIARAWFLLIPGLAMVILFVIVSVLFPVPKT